MNSEVFKNLSGIVSSLGLKGVEELEEVAVENLTGICSILGLKGVEEPGEVAVANPQVAF